MRRRRLSPLEISEARLVFGNNYNFEKVFVIEEIYRVLKSGGRFEHLTPSTDGRGAFQDPYHLSFWNINSWHYYTLDHCREQYGTKAKFKIRYLEDVVTDKPGRVIHTYGLMYAIK